MEGGHSNQDEHSVSDSSWLPYIHPELTFYFITFPFGRDASQSAPAAGPEFRRRNLFPSNEAKINS